MLRFGLRLLLVGTSIALLVVTGAAGLLLLSGAAVRPAALVDTLAAAGGLLFLPAGFTLPSATANLGPLVFLWAQAGGRLNYWIIRRDARDPGRARLSWFSGAAGLCCWLLAACIHFLVP